MAETKAPEQAKPRKKIFSGEVFIEFFSQGLAKKEP